MASHVVIARLPGHRSSLEWRQIIAVIDVNAYSARTQAVILKIK
jgi:hypothetical protein